jgi:YVTN family beta-propeller protein
VELGAISVRRGGRVRRSPVVVGVVGFTMIAASMIPSIAGAHVTTSTAPTPPDLFVAYAPLVAQGNTPGADTVESFNTATLQTASLPSGASVASQGSAQVGAQPVSEVVSPDGGTVYVLNSASDSITPVSTLGSPPVSEATISLPAGYTPQAMALTPDGTNVYVVAMANLSNTAAPVLWEIALGGASPGTLARTITLPANSSPAGLALTPDGQEALVTDYSGGAVIPVSLSSAKVGTPIPVGSGPLGIGVSPNGANAYVANSEEGSITQIDLANNTPSSPNTPLEVGFQPQQVAVSPDGSTLWVSEDNAHTPGNAGFAVPVSIPSMSVGAPISAGFDPYGVALSPDGSTLFVADESNGYGPGHSKGAVTMINTSTGTAQIFYTNIDPALVVVTPDEAPFASFTFSPIAAGHATCFDASASYSLTNGGLKYNWNFGDGTVSLPPQSSNGYNEFTCHTFNLAGNYSVTLSVTDASGTSTQVVYTGQYVSNNGGPSAGFAAQVIVPDPSVSRPAVAYVTNSQSNSVTPVLADPSQAISPNDAGTPIPVGTHPDALAISPDAQTVYVANYGSNNITPIHVATNLAAPAGAWINVGSEPDGIAITPNGATAYVANSGDGTISKIALATRQVVATITVGGSPSSIAISPDGLTAYVTNNAPGYENVIPINLTNNAVLPGVAIGTLVAGVPTATDPVAIVISPDGHMAYVAARGSNIVPGAVTPITLTTSPATPGSPLAVGNQPSGLAVTPDASALYVTNYADGTISQITLTNDALGAVTVSNAGSDPVGVAVTPDGATAYIADAVPAAQSVTTGTLSELGLPATAGTPTPITVGAGPNAVAITPDQAPVASLVVTAGLATQPSHFDASQSVFPSAPGASYYWDFGDGTNTTTTVSHVDHSYAVGGNYPASVTVSDTDGTSTAQIFTGQTVSLNGAASARAMQTVKVPFVIATISSIAPSSGQENEVTSLIITGTNFFGVTGVSVGGHAVTGYVVDPSGTQISNVLAPALSAGSVDVTVSNPAGTTAITPTDIYTYLPGSAPVSGAPVVTNLSLHWGPVAGGTGVTITGTNFTGASAVHFGSASASTFSVNAAGTAITVLSPPAAGAGTLDVTVTTAVATSQIAVADAFSYLAPPPVVAAPVVTALSPNFGPTSGLSSVDITGENFANVSAVKFGAIAAESFVVNSQGDITAVSPAVAAAGTVDVTVITSVATSAVTLGDAFTYEDGTSSAGPVVTSVVANSGPLSGGQSVVINGSNFSGIGSSGVSFGSVVASSFTVNSAGTKITANEPAAAVAATVDVIVTNALGSSTVTPADTYTYLADQNFAPTVTQVSPNFGPTAGTNTVTLTGTELGQVTTVNFGGAAVTTFSVSGAGDKIFVAAPASSAGTVSVTATSPYGTSAISSADAYTFTDGPGSGTGPQITSLTPQIGPISGGTGVVITGTNLAAVSSVYFGATPATTFTADASGTQIVAVAPAAAAAGSVDVTVSDGSSTSSIEVADVLTYLDGISPPGPTIISVSPASGPLTGGSLVTVTGANLGGALVVSFGSANGSSIVVSPSGTSLTVHSPAASYYGTVSVTVGTPAGSSAASPAAVFTYNEVASVYHPLSAYRILDTRTPTGGGLFAPGESRTLTFSGVDSVPVGATGVIVNVTVTDETSATSVTLWPTGQLQPSVVSLVAAKGDTVAHLEEVPLGANGQLSIFNRSGMNHVVVDLEGYYSAGTSSSGGFIALHPTVAYNSALKSAGGPLSAGQARLVTLGGKAGVPSSGVGAVVFQLVDSGATFASYATVYPNGQSRPNASNLNWSLGSSMSNLVVTPLGAGGAVRIYNHFGKVNLMLIVTGYFSGPGAPIAGSFNTPAISSALYSSSSGGGALAGGHARTVAIGAVGVVPLNASFAVLNVTVSSTTTASSLMIYPSGSAKPVVAQLTWLKGQSRSTLVVVPLGANGSITLLNQLGAANVTVSVEGYGA